MLTCIPPFRCRAVKTRLVNCAPWPVLKISGCSRASACSGAFRYNGTSAPPFSYASRYQNARSQRIESQGLNAMPRNVWLTADTS